VAIDRSRLVLSPATPKKFQLYGLFRIRMREALQHFSHLHFNAQLLAQFANETLLEGFAPLAFATGKFPQPAEVRPRVPLRDEEFAPAKNKAGRDFNDE
jgi:hypothetical protein